MIDATTVRRCVFVGYLASLGAASCYGSVAVAGRTIVTNFAPLTVVTSFSMMLSTAVVAMMFQGRLEAESARYISSPLSSKDCLSQHKGSGLTGESKGFLDDLLGEGRRGYMSCPSWTDFQRLESNGEV